MKINFNVFVSSEKMLLQQFREWWRCEHVKDNAAFPSSMTIAEFEQAFADWKERNAHVTER